MATRPFMPPTYKDPNLRPYQQESKDKIYKTWQEVDNVMFQMPTGTGKTFLFCSIIRDLLQKARAERQDIKVLVIAHRKELIDQIDQSLSKYNVPHSKFVGAKYQRDMTPPVLVTSVQTITHKKNADERVALKNKVTYIVIDEAHHAVASTYRKLWTCFPNARRLGVTATPYRLGKEGFSKLFQRLILSQPVKEFIRQGYLAPYTYYSLKADSEVKRAIDSLDEFDAFGDYKESALESKMDRDHIRAQLLKSYQKYANGKKGIIYTINRAHSAHVCQKFRSAGLRVESIDAETPKATRDYLVQQFRYGRIDILVNVNIFSEGFDCPDIEFIQLARPTTSLSMYLQQVGRGLRTTAGKSRCIILDNVGAHARFGLPDANRKWKYHFNGIPCDETPPKPTKKIGSGSTWTPDLSEGDEQMEVIQQFTDNEVQSNDIIVAKPAVYTKEPFGDEELNQVKIVTPDNETIYWGAFYDDDDLGRLMDSDLQYDVLDYDDMKITIELATDEDVQILTYDTRGNGLDIPSQDAVNRYRYDDDEDLVEITNDHTESEKTDENANNVKKEIGFNYLNPDNIHDILSTFSTLLTNQSQTKKSSEQTSNKPLTTSDRIYDYIKKHPNCMAKHIASALGLERKTVNSILYGSLSGKVIQNALYEWKIR